MAAYRGVLFDLFGTLIAFDPSRLPELAAGAERVRTTVAGLEALLAEWVPGVGPVAVSTSVRSMIILIGRPVLRERTAATGSR